LWAHRRLPSKNALTAEDARIIDAAGQRILEICRDPEIDQAGNSSYKAAVRFQPFARHDRINSGRNPCCR
jgi:hypothetical protein